MKANYHTHTYRCKHAQGTEEEYVLSAIESGITVLGFSDHAPFPDEDYGYRMDYEELDSYLQTIDLLIKKYSTAIILLKGLEIEYMSKYRSYYETLLTEKRMDYLLLGEHFFYTPAGKFFNVASADSTERYLDYAQAMDEALRTGYYKIVAHPDIFLMNPFAWDRNCDLATDRIIESALLTHTTLEFNANGFRRGIKPFPDGERYQYPHTRFWKKVAEAGVPVLVGSDCHNPTQIWDLAMSKAYKELSLLGIEPIQHI